MFASFHNFLITILTPTWTHFSDIAQFLQVSRDLRGISTLTRNWTYFGHKGQFPQLSYDIYGMLRLFWRHWPIPQLPRSSYGILLLTHTHTYFGEITNLGYS